MREERGRRDAAISPTARRSLSVCRSVAWPRASPGITAGIVRCDSVECVNICLLLSTLMSFRFNQGVYCLQHTRYSPHASYGECGMMSKVCVCASWFVATHVFLNGCRGAIHQVPQLATTSTPAILADPDVQIVPLFAVFR